MQSEALEDFCSHPGDLEYYHTFITDFWINLGYYNTFIRDFWIYLGILEHCKTSNTDFCSHPGDLKYS